MKSCARIGSIGLAVAAAAVVSTVSFLKPAVALDPPAKPSTTTAAGPSAPSASKATEAETWFAKFKGLVGGTWEGANQDGMKCKLTYTLIAGGSCVMETCEIEAHPDSTMITMYHLDGDKLMLTHYCMAGNQPRMRATSFDDKSGAVTFTYIDGTNLASRDVGHMDSAIFRFPDANTYTSRWTWYEDGKESWMEEFAYTHKP